MAGSKREKKIKQKATPKGQHIAQGGDPGQYYSQTPAWAFTNADTDMWTFSPEHIGDLIWTEILPKLQNFEKQTWSEILVANKKQNHSLDLKDLNKAAQDRLATKYIEAESLISLRLSGKQRIYGYMTGRVFNILWYDDDHGDNNTCVCRSHKKHT